MSPYTFHGDGIQTGGTDRFILELVDIANPITPGNYNNISILHLNKNCQITYITGAGIWSLSIQNPNTFVVNLISFTSTRATGTFSGTVYNNSNTKIITNGSFSISY